MNRKFRFLCAISLTTLVAGLSNIAAHAQTFAAGDVVVYRVGDGSAALTNGATAVFLDEYNPITNTLVQSVALPTAASGSNLAFTATGNATSEGELNLSANGQYLALTGYNAAVGTTGLVATTSATVPRVVGIVGNGAIDTSTSFIGTTFSAGNIRGAYTTDGSNIYAVGSNTGVVNTTKGTSGTGTVISTTATNLRDVVVSNGQLYVSTASGTTFRIGAVGTGTPTTTGQTTVPLAGTSSSSPTAPYAFFFASLAATNDTLYVADANVIDKFSLVGGSYTATGTITGITGVQGLTGSVSNGTVSLYATNPTAIYKATDASGYNGTASGAAASAVTVSTNEGFRGIAYLPNAIAFGVTSNATPEPGVLPFIAEAGVLAVSFGLLRRRRNVA